MDAPTRSPPDQELRRRRLWDRHFRLRKLIRLAVSQALNGFRSNLKTLELLPGQLLPSLR